MHIAAIDNSLSFPHEHPKGWRSFTYGWLYLPVSLIGRYVNAFISLLFANGMGIRPFSEQTRRHFLPLLSSRSWWEETTYELKKLFAVDPDFHPKMFARQMAVIKGQAWNVLQSLKHPDEGTFCQFSADLLIDSITGPLELTRRVKILIWDDELEVGESFSAEAISGPLSAGAAPNGFNRGSPTRPRRLRSASSPRDFPPRALSRASSDLTGSSRPVPFSSKVTRINPSATGVSVLEHLERLDKVEEGLKRLGPNEDVLFEDEEDGETTAYATPPMQEPESIDPVVSTQNQQASTSTVNLVPSSQASAKPRLSGISNGTRPTLTVRMSEDAGRPSHVRWASQGTEGRTGRSMDVSRNPLRDGSATKKVISEVRLLALQVEFVLICFL
jgi:phosphatidylinositol 4-kinase type 2